MSNGTLFLLAGLLLGISVFGSKMSGRFGFPSLLAFLGVGMLAGSDGFGGITFDNPYLAQRVGSFSLVFILFAGALDTRWKEVRPVLGPGILLSTLGVFLTALLVGGFAWFFLGFAPLEGLLLGAIVSSTDAAAVFSVLRSRGVGLRGGLKPLLELESGSNDPMAAFLTAALVSLLGAGDLSWPRFALWALGQMPLGALMGFLLGRGTLVLLNRVRLDHEGLYPVLTSSLALVTFGAAESLGGNGFLGVYVMGLVLGNGRFLHERSLTRFHDGLGWLMQIVMFLVLGLLVFPSRLPAVTSQGLLLTGFLLFAARPVAVFACLIRGSFGFREKVLLSWAGLRGAVPIVLATFPFTAGNPRSDLIFNLVFFVVLLSVFLQGSTLMSLARALGLDEPSGFRPRYPLEFDRTGHADEETREFWVVPGSRGEGRRVADLGLPREALILLVRRGGRFLVPRGDTTLLGGDALLVLADPAVLDRVGERLEEIPSPVLPPEEPESP